MDQDAFRNMLSAPRTDAGPSRHQKGNFGGAGPKRGWGIKQTKEYKTPLPHEAKEADEKKEAHIAPRHVQKKQPAETKYKDRAEMRRTGKDDEYKDVETMLADFEKRKAEAEDAETVEKTRQFLGGDAAHSVMVKGLDYALLAQRKAELQREQEVDRDEELDAMMDDFGSKKADPSGDKTEKKKQPEEKLGKGFKSIGQRKEEAANAGEKKKKKKKKVVKQEEQDMSKAEVKKDLKSDNGRKDKVEPPSKPTVPPPPAVPAPVVPADEPEEDIFGDAGEYDLGGGAVSDDDSENEPEVSKPPAKLDAERERGRSLSREGDGRRYDLSSRSRSSSRRRDDSRSPDRRRRSPPRSYHRDRSDSRDRPRYRSRSRTPPRRRHRSPSRSPIRRYRSPSRSPRRRAYSPARSPRRYRSPSRSRSPYGNKRRRYRSPSRSPPRRLRRSPSPYSRQGHYRSPSYSRSRSPAPPRRRSTSRDGDPGPKKKQNERRQQSRSPSPFMFAGPPMSRSPSASRSPSPIAQGGRLQPLQSSAISDLSGFLAAESASAKADEKKIKKAQWRARQGLGIQEGVDPSVLKKEMNDKQKSNREYVLLMNKLKKDEAGGGGGGGEGSKDNE